MEFIINFFEYYVYGFWYILYLIFFVILGFSLIGVVGEKATKKKIAEEEAKREERIKEEYKKAHELIEKQANTYSVDMTLDPEAAKAANEVPLAADEKPKEKKQEVIDFDAPSTSDPNAAVDNLTPIVDNTSEEAVKTEDVPAVLVIDDDGSSNA